MLNPQKQSVFRKKRVLFSITLSFLLGIFIGTVAHKSISEIFRKKILFYEVREGNYTFINPLIECEGSGISHELIPFRDKVAQLIRMAVQNKQILDAAVYFRDLNNGPWFGVNENEKYFPASLLKVNIMMAYFKNAESDPQILQQTRLYDGKLSFLQPYFKPEETLKIGKSYTIEELIRRMIVYSDNEAKEMLLGFDPEAITRIHRDLGLEPWKPGQPEPQFSVTSYASLFRMLFNASYLNRDFSEKALEILSQTQFPYGLLQGVPGGTVVAHKFGERYENWIWQLHDCGIIYYPKRPYLLCVFAKGANIENLEKLIADISRLVFSEVSRQNT